jgi:hypothetical protein
METDLRKKLIYLRKVHITMIGCYHDANAHLIVIQKYSIHF